MRQDYLVDNDTIRLPLWRCAVDRPEEVLSPNARHSPRGVWSNASLSTFGGR